MKFIIICCLFLSASLYAKAPIANGLEQRQFSDHFKTQKNLDQFIYTLITTDKEIALSEVKENIKESTQGLFFHKLVVETPLVPEFTYQLLKRPDALSGVLGILLKRNALIIFFTLFLFSFIVGHYLGEIKFFFKPMSGVRLFYSIVRFTGINTLRVWLFVYFFAENMTPLKEVYFTSLSEVKIYHPILYATSHYVAELF